MAATPAQLQALLGYCTEFAQAMLKDSGDFYPFGATLSSDGDVVAAGGHDGNEKPEPQAIYQLLASAFSTAARAGNISGAALAANVNVPEQYQSPSKDAIRVHVEAAGFARFIYIPYEIAKPGLFKRGRALTIHDPFSVDVGPGFFPKLGEGE
jgi:hypothetical protein